MKDCTIVTVGHVDHGKSSLIGRLMADANVLPKGKLQEVRQNCERSARPFEYAYLLDALQCEQREGITLDVARGFFVYQGKQFEVLDAPGHAELIRNMVTGASRADAALLVVDASCGVEENTRRHAYYLGLLGVSQVVVAVNKMDLVGYQEARYRAVVAELAAYLTSVGVEARAYIPVSAVEGDNVVISSARMPWYTGETLLSLLMRLEPPVPRVDLPLRLMLQDVYRVGEMGATRRILAGTIATGTLSAGDEITFLPSGKRTVVRSVETASGAVERAEAGQAVGFTIADELVVMRGETVVRTAQERPTMAVSVRADLLWLGAEPLEVAKTYTLRIGTARTRAVVKCVESVLQPDSLAQVDAAAVQCNQVATVVLNLDSPIVFDEERAYETNRFVLVADYDVVGGGQIVAKIEDLAYDGKRLRRTYSNASSAARLRANMGDGAVVWLTGLSGSGKTTIATGAAEALLTKGVNAYVLDGDSLRAGLNSDLDFSPEGRHTNVLRAGQVARILAEAGVVVLVTLISPFRADRLAVKQMVGDRFWGVWVKADPATCSRRDPKGLYVSAEESFRRHVADYEAPTFADLVLDTDAMSEVQAVDALVDFVLHKAR